MLFIKKKPRSHTPKQIPFSVQESRMMKIIFVLLVIALMWIIFAPGSGIMTLMNKRSELERLQQETAQIEQQIGSLQKEIDRLHDDPAYLEKVARKDFDLLKKNEKVYDFSTPESEKKK